MNTLTLVREFHRVFVDGRMPKRKQRAIRVPLLKEEVRELEEAVAARDRRGILDALLDIQYVTDGAFIAFDFDGVKHRAFKEVHRSNMSKLDKDGKPIIREDGKILKGPNYRPPNLAQFL